jgi:uncharacterized membrane protein
MPTVTRLGRFITTNGIRIVTLARESGYSRQHLRRLRLGEAEPTRHAMVQITKACRRILTRAVEITDLFDLGDDDALDAAPRGGVEAGHGDPMKSLPLHRMLIVFPLGLLGTSFLFDVAWRVLGRSDLAVDAYWIMIAGVVGAGIASVFGAMTWKTIPPGTRARRIGALHGIGNVIVSALFVGSALLRRGDPAHPHLIALVLSALGVLLIVGTGWLGGQLVQRDEAGVEMSSRA